MPRVPVNRLALAVLAGFAWTPGVAPAADAPLLIPTRDVAVTYRTEQGGRILEQRMRWSAAARRMRVDPPTPGTFLLVDYAAHRMDVVRDAERSFIEMDAPATMPGLGAPGLGAPGEGRYARGAEAAVAGIACTEWSTRDPQGREATVCVTSDGVLLRVSLDARVLAAAVRIDYSPQDAALFRVPAGYARKERPR